METKFKLGLVSKRLMLYSYDWYHIRSLIRTLVQIFIIYIHVMIYLLQGENTSVSISVITHFMQGRTYNLFSAGEAFVHTKCHHQKGEECWNLLLMIHLWSHFNGALLHKSIQEFYMIKTSQREWIMMCIVIVDSMLKALTHTHTHHSLLVDL